MCFILDTCPGAEIIFQGRLGVFVEGQIHPPLQSVEITVKPQDEAGSEIKISTDANGKYRYILSNVNYAYSCLDNFFSEKNYVGESCEIIIQNRILNCKNQQHFGLRNKRIYCRYIKKKQT